MKYANIICHCYEQKHRQKHIFITCKECMLYDIIKLVIRKPTIKLSLSYITYYSYISPYKRLLLITCARCEMIMCRFHAFYNVNIK